MSETNRDSHGNESLTPIRRIGVVGAGAWGTALALAARRAGREVTLWAHEPEIAAAIATEGENPVYLPGVRLEAGIRGTADLADLAASEAILLVTPAQHIAGIASRLARHLAAPTPLVIAAKGLVLPEGRLLSAVLAEIAPAHPVLVLSGPTFAIEVARGQPTALTLAGEDPVLVDRLIASLGTPTFRPYAGQDLIGVQVGGAVKNVIAIAAGITDGMRLGDNARAALITRGLAEIARLGAALGADPATFMGLSGLGDLSLTCASTQSRNYSFGAAIGAGQRAEEVLAGRRAVTEGVKTAAATMALANRLGVEMPITQAVDAIINHGAPLADTLQALLARPFRAERV